MPWLLLMFDSTTGASVVFDRSGDRAEWRGQGVRVVELARNDETWR